MHTSFSYKAFTDTRQPLGRKNGYQFLWKEAEASVGAGLVQFTFLHDRTFYSLSSLADDSTRLLLARTGANDPQFNLRSEPSFIIRKKGAAQLFVNVIEIHGNFDPVSEVSTQADPQVKNIELLCNDADFTIARIAFGAKTLVLARCNKDMEAGTAHSFSGSAGALNWKGPYAVWVNGSLIQ